MNAEAEGAEGVDACGSPVGAVPMRVAQRGDPALRQLRQPPKDVLAALQLLTRLVKALVAQELRSMSPAGFGPAVCIAVREPLGGKLAMGA